MAHAASLQVEADASLQVASMGVKYMLGHVPMSWDGRNRDTDMCPAVDRGFQESHMA